MHMRRKLYNNFILDNLQKCIHLLTFPNNVRLNQDNTIYIFNCLNNLKKVLYSLL